MYLTLRLIRSFFSDVTLSNGFIDVGDDSWRPPSSFNLSEFSETFQRSKHFFNFARFFSFSLGSFELKQKLFTFRFSKFLFFSNCFFQLHVFQTIESSLDNYNDIYLVSRWKICKWVRPDCFLVQNKNRRGLGKVDWWRRRRGYRRRWRSFWSGEVFTK